MIVMVLEKKMSANDMWGVAEFEFQNVWFVTYSVESWNESRAACYLFARDMRVSIYSALRASRLYYRPRLIQIEKLAIRRGQSISG